MYLFLRYSVYEFRKSLHMLQNLQHLTHCQKCQLDTLVDFEKCRKTRLYSQRSVPIEPKTSNISPKFCRSAVVSLTVARRTPPAPSQCCQFSANNIYFGKCFARFPLYRHRSLQATTRFAAFFKISHII